MNIFLKKFIEKKFTKPGKALDLGAGKFYNVACIRRLGWKCKGVDKDDEINLEQLYLDSDRPFNLVFSTYVLHKLNNKKQLIRTACENLGKNGWVFIHAFDKSDKLSKSTLTSNYLRSSLQKEGFKNISIKLIDSFDNDIGHKHWHKILEATAQKE